MNPPVEIWHWLAVSAVVTVLLIFDLVVFHRESKDTTLREAALATFVWFLLAMVFNAVIWWVWGAKAATEFLAGYAVEWSLSMDNVFVFAVIFVHFRVPKKYQYRVLFWGILGAIVLRLSFVLAGAKLIEMFAWINVFFGAFLVYTAIKLLVADDEFDPEKDILFRITRRFFPIAKGDHGDHFFVREAGKWCITPLFVVLLVVDSADTMFAVDSVPAIFGVTNESFIVFTSNLFAIMGLRALYFLLAGVMDMFRYLKYGLSAILGFVGVKMILEYVVQFPAVAQWLPQFFQARVANPNNNPNFHPHLISPLESLLVILALLAASIIASLVASRQEVKQKEPAEAK